MDTSSQGSELYQMRMEGPFDPLREGGFLSEVVATWPVEGDVHAGLVRVMPEQLPRLRELLHVQSLEPAADGLYVDRLGHWYAIAGGTVAHSGWYGLVPREALLALGVDGGMAGAAPAPASASAAPLMAAPAPTPQSTGPAFAPAPAAATGAARERDPVCGMELRPGLEEASTTYQGQSFHFCSVECRDLFLKNPAAYLGGGRRTAVA